MIFIVINGGGEGEAVLPPDSEMVLNVGDGDTLIFCTCDEQDGFVLPVGEEGFMVGDFGGEGGRNEDEAAKAVGFSVSREGYAKTAIGKASEIDVVGVYVGEAAGMVEGVENGRYATLLPPIAKAKTGCNQDEAFLLG